MNKIERILAVGKSVGETALALAPGLRNLVSDVKGEFTRLAIHGAMELASANHNGNAFVPYGPGQYTPSTEDIQPHEPHENHQLDQQQEHQIEMER